MSSLLHMGLIISYGKALTSTAFDKVSVVNVKLWLVTLYQCLTLKCVFLMGMPASLASSQQADFAACTVSF